MTSETMKALVKKYDKPGLWLDEVPVPEVGINDVLIKIHKASICGTDVHIWNWDAWAQKTIPVPMVVGHEFVGRIVEVGNNVKDFRVGELVSGEGHVVCGRCRNCMAGRRHLCAHTSGIGVNRPGAFAEYISLPMSNVWVHREGIDLDTFVEQGRRLDRYLDRMANWVLTEEEADLVLVDERGAALDPSGPQPSSEVALHLACYRARPDVAAVVHAHPPTAVARTLVGKGIDPMAA